MPVETNQRACPFSTSAHVVGRSLESQGRDALLASALVVGVDMIIVSLAGAHSPLRLVLTILILLSFLIFSFDNRRQRFRGLSPPPRKGWRYWSLRAFGVGVLLSLVFVANASICVTLGLTPDHIQHRNQIWTWFMWMCLIFPVLEEVLYRVVLVPPIAAQWGIRTAVLIGGGTFILLHVVYHNIGPDNVVGGFALTWLFLRSRCFLISLAAHIIWNLGWFAWHVLFFIFVVTD